MATFTPKEHEVTLIAPSGVEKRVTLRISRSGVRLVAKNEAKDVNKFPFEVIKKWLPANLRSRNPGSDDCLDLQIETDKGARDLRMRCKDAEHVQLIITDLRDTVTEVMREYEAKGITLEPRRRPEPEPSSEIQAAEQQGEISAEPTTPRSPRDPQSLKQVWDMPDASKDHSLPSSAASQQGAEQPAQPAAQVSSGRSSSSTSDASAVLAEASAIPGAIPVQVLGALPSAGPGPGTQVIIAASTSDSAQPAPASSAQRAQSGQQQKPPKPQPKPKSSSGKKAGKSAGVQPWGRPGGSGEEAEEEEEGDEEDLEISSRMLSYGPAFMNAAFDKSASPQGIRHGSFTYFAGGGATGGPVPSRPSTSAARSLGTPGLGGFDGAGRLGMSPTGAASLAAPEAAVMARRRADGQVSALEAQVTELTSQNSFLESLVKRLSAELARRQAALGESGASTETELLVDDGSPMPGWLKDRRYLNPLLAAYDDKIAGLEAEAGARTEQIARLQRQVEDVVAENEKLRGDLARSMESKALAVAAAEGSSSPGKGSRDGALALLREEIELLRQENDLLLTQQNDMDLELQRLHRQAEDHASAAIRAAQEHATSVALAQQQTARTQEMEAKYGKLQSSLRTAENRAMALAQQLADTKSQLEDARIAADTATRTLGDLQAAHAALQNEAAAATQRARSAAEGQATLQVEVVTLRERYDAAAAEASTLRREAEALRGALGAVEARLTDYQRKDADVYSRIKEAMEMAEEARLARDSAAARQRELEREVEALQTRLAGVRQAVRDQVYSELQGTIHDLTAQLEVARDSLKVSEGKAAEQRAAADRATREVASLSAELAALKEDLGETLSSKSKVTLMSLSTMEKIQEIARERDEATQALETRTRQLDRAQRDWALERQNLESEMRSLRKAVADLESGATMARSEAAGYARQCEALGREVAALREAKARSDRELRAQITAARTERDQEVKAMAARLEAALGACGRSVSEAERLMESKEALLARWKEEAQTIASKLERALGEHRRELDARDAESAELRSALDALGAAHAAAVSEVQELRSAINQMQGALTDAESRGAQLHMQLLAAGSREEELNQEIRSLQGMLERARFESKPRSQGLRSGDALSAKFEALRRGGDAVVGISLSPTGLVLEKGAGPGQG